VQNSLETSNLSLGISLERNPVGIVNEAIKDSICQGRIRKSGMPIRNGNLGTDCLAGCMTNPDITWVLKQARQKVRDLFMIHGVWRFAFTIITGSLLLWFLAKDGFFVS